MIGAGDHADRINMTPEEMKLAEILAEMAPRLIVSSEHAGYLISMLDLLPKLVAEVKLLTERCEIAKEYIAEAPELILKERNALRAQNIQLRGRVASLCDAVDVAGRALRNKCSAFRWLHDPNQTVSISNDVSAELHKAAAQLKEEG